MTLNSYDLDIIECIQTKYARYFWIKNFIHNLISVPRYFTVVYIKRSFMLHVSEVGTLFVPIDKPDYFYLT